jgi:hypothetical protein
MTHTVRITCCALFTAALSACGPSTTTVRGTVGDDVGTQRQALEPITAPAPAFGGEGTAAASTRVSAWGSQGGSLSLLAEADVGAGGAFALQLPPDAERVVIFATDAQGQARAAVLLDRAGPAGGERQAAPMSAETSLEAAVFAQMLAQGMAADEVDTVSLRALLDAKVAAAVQARQQAGEETEKWVAALAESARVAQQARLRAYARAGVDVTARALFEAQVEASAQLDAALHARQDAQAAYARFYAALDAARERLGAKAKERAEGERAASAGFRGTLRIRVDASADASPLLTAAVKAAAEEEARAQEAAATAALGAGAQADAARARVTAAFATLGTDVRAAATASAVAAAYARLSASLATDAQVDATAFGTHLGVSTATRASADAAVSASAQAAAALDAALAASFGAAAGAPEVSSSALAQEVVDAHAAFSSAVRAQAATLAAFGPKVEGGLELLVIAQGSFAGAGD